MSEPELSVSQTVNAGCADNNFEELKALLEDLEAAVALLPPEELEASEACKRSIVFARNHAVLHEGRLYIA